MNKVINLLKQPYPIENYNSRSHTKVFLSLLGQGTFITLFLYAFKPFRIDMWMEQDPNVVGYLVAFGFITFLAGAIIEFILVPLFPKYYVDTNWTVIKEIFKILLLLFLIALGNMSFMILINLQSFTLNAFIFSISAVVLIGIFPVGFGILANYIVQLKKYQQPVEVVHHEEKLEEVTLIAENEKDIITLTQKQIQFIESADNYAIVYYNNGESQKKEMLRSSLSRLEQQVEAFGIVRCHRSFIVNLNRVEHVTGNAQGYRLHISNSEEVVPVARKYSNIVKELKG